jgi:hypothetical protein
MDLNPNEFNSGEDELLNNEVNLRDERETLKEPLGAHLSQLLHENPWLSGPDLTNHLTYGRITHRIREIF